MPMPEYLVVQKPDNISFDVIHDLLYKAHGENIKKGIIVKTALLNGEELREYIKRDGKCFVALDGNKLIGTLSVRVVPRNTWYSKKPIIETVLIGVDPEYSGKGVYAALEKAATEHALNQGYDMITFCTPENNIPMINSSLKKGYRLVSFFSSKTSELYFVVMLKWLKGAQYTEQYCNFRFKLKRFWVKLSTKPGNKKRIGFRRYLKKIKKLIQR
jgi:GNAT superfamily N-acetyltransferase